MCIKGISVRSFFTVEGTHSGNLSKGKMTLGALAVAGLVTSAVGAAGIFGTGLAKVATASLNTRIRMTVGGAVTALIALVKLFLNRKQTLGKSVLINYPIHPATSVNSKTSTSQTKSSSSLIPVPPADSSPNSSSNLTSPPAETFSSALDSFIFYPPASAVGQEPFNWNFDTIFINNGNIKMNPTDTNMINV